MKKGVVRLVISFFVFCYCGNNAFAVPAYPNKVRVETANGKTVSVFMRGDEYLKYAVTEDGYTLLSDSSGWWYANHVDGGEIKKSGFRLMSKEDETEELKLFKASCPKGIVPQRNVQEQYNRASDTNNASHSGPMVGERRALVILMQYTDCAFKKTRDDFETLFNTFDYKQDGAKGSVRDFYRYASQSQLDYVSDVYGPYTSQYPMRYYGGNSINGGSDKNPLQLCIEAIKSLPNDIDFSLYDNDGDGVVDNVHIIYAGYGEEAGASSDAIWAHEYPHRISLKNEVGYSFAGYSCSPELRGNHGSGITNIGVICHELGHALGAMDYYDTNYGTGGKYEGTGNWDIMASGSWNDEGRTPPNFNPYVRSSVFGWNKQAVLNSDQRISLPRREIDNAEQSVIYRIETGSEGDYFLIENRQQYLFDAAIPGSGLMVYHVHPNIDRYNTTNTVNATHPQGLYPVCASHSEPSKKEYGNINSSECPFPGSNNKREFSSTSSPAAVAWNGSLVKVSLSYITMNAFDGTITFTTGKDTIDEPDIPDIPVEKEVVYKESFESSITGRLLTTTIMGKEVWRTYKKGDFVMNADNLPEPTDGDIILMLYSGKGKAMNESEAISEDIPIEAGANYCISFDIYCKSVSTSQTPLFNLYVEDEYGEYNVFTQNKTTSKWEKIEIPLVFAGSQFKYKLFGRIYTGGIFVDNIRLYKEIRASSINMIEISQELGNEAKLYKLDGSYVGQYRKQLTNLPSGLYIVRQGTRSYKIVL